MIYGVLILIISVRSMVLLEVVIQKKSIEEHYKLKEQEEIKNVANNNNYRISNRYICFVGDDVPL